MSQIAKSAAVDLQEAMLTISLDHFIDDVGIMLGWTFRLPFQHGIKALSMLNGLSQFSRSVRTVTVRPFKILSYPWISDQEPFDVVQGYESSCGRPECLSRFFR